MITDLANDFLIRCRNKRYRPTLDLFLLEKVEKFLVNGQVIQWHIGALRELLLELRAPAQKPERN